MIKLSNYQMIETVYLISLDITDTLKHGNPWMFFTPFVGSPTLPETAAEG